MGLSIWGESTLLRFYSFLEKRLLLGVKHSLGYPGINRRKKTALWPFKEVLGVFSRHRFAPLRGAAC